MKKTKIDILTLEGEDWVIRSEKDPTKILGKFPSKEEAIKRLGQIEGFKARGDSKIYKRFDSLGRVHCDASIKDEGIFAEKTPEGYLKCKAKITRIGVFDYEDADGNAWGEYRDESEVFDQASMESWAHLIVTCEHPPEMITAENTKKYQVGHMGSEVVREGDFLVAILVITDPNTIRLIEKGIKVELSCGYYVEVIDKPGVWNGIPYQKIQTIIRGNHCAVVDQGRAGPECRLVLDSISAKLTRGNNKEDTMTQKRKNVDRKKGLMPKRSENKDALMQWGDQSFEVPDAFLEEYKAMEAKLAASQEAESLESEAEALEESVMEEPEAEAPSMDEEMMPLPEEEMAMDEGEESVMEEEPKPAMDSKRTKKVSLDSLVGERIALLDSARSILGGKVQPSANADSIKRACIYKVCPSLKGSFDSASKEVLDGAFKVVKAISASRQNADSKRKALNDSLFNSVARDGKKPRALAALDSLSNKRQKGNK